MKRMSDGDVIPREAPAARDGLLTECEAQVLQLLAHGASVAAIADRLFSGHRSTAQMYLAVLCAKLDLQTIEEVRTQHGLG